MNPPPQPQFSRKMLSFRAFFLTILASIPAVTAISSPPPAAKKNPLESLSAEDRQAAQTCMEAYRKSEFNPSERRSALKDAAKLPRPAQEVFLAVVDADVGKALNTYRTEFKKFADKIAQSRDSKATRDEIKKLRADVLGLSKLGGGLTKEKIHEIGEPAVKRLRELFTFSREMVLSSDAALGISRDRLVTLLEGREGLRNSIGIKDNKDFPVAKLLDEEKSIAEKAPPYDRDALKVMEANKKLGEKTPPEEVKGVLITNELRALLGLSALVIDPKLCDAGRGHSKDMVEKGFFAHESPVAGKKSPWDRAKLAGTTASAENIFAGSPDPKAAVDAWFYSPGHHVNMLNPGHRRMGMGRHDGDWTQMFGG